MNMHINNYFETHRESQVKLLASTNQYGFSRINSTSKHSQKLWTKSPKLDEKLQFLYKQQSSHLITIA